MKQCFSFFLCVLFLFCACSNDIEVQDNNDIEVQDNQMYFNGHIYEMSSAGASYSSYTKKYSISAKNPQTIDWSYIVYADSSLVGKKVDLANIDQKLLDDGVYLYIEISYIVGIPIKDFIGYYSLSINEGRVRGSVSGDTLGEETLYDESPFKEGSLLITNDGSNLKFSLNGTLKNGKHTATTIVVPEKDIRIVTPMY